MMSIPSSAAGCTPTSSTLILRADFILERWYRENDNEISCTGLLKVLGKMIAIAPINLAIAALSVTVGLIYDITMVIFWGNLVRCGDEAMASFQAHLYSLCNAPSNALWHLLGIFPCLSYDSKVAQNLQYLNIPEFQEQHRRGFGLLQ
jgi:hypothetical protein